MKAVLRCRCRTTARIFHRQSRLFARLSREKLIAVIFLACALFCVVHVGEAQERDNKPGQFTPPATPPQSDPPKQNVIISPLDDYRIGPSDVIEVAIRDAPEISGEFRVNATGVFQLPVIGAVTALRKTTDELSKAIASGLHAGGYLVNPQVIVTVKQINSRSFFIQGAVRRPGLYQVEGRPTLLKLITIAGGLADNYGSSAFIIRETKQASNDDTKYELLKGNINSLLRGNFDQNLPVEPGDIVHIPVSDIFFVAGEVNAPGSFPLKEGTTLRQAVSLAQGTTFEAAAKRGLIFREEPASGERREIKVDVAAVMSGEQKDVPVMANDIIIVPNSRLKSATGILLRGFGLAAPRIMLPGRGIY